jgi:NADH-quinone oxidoreductase subunit L
VVIENLLWLILILPLASAATITLVTLKNPRISSYISVGAIVGAFCISLIPFFRMFSAGPEFQPIDLYWYWINIPNFQIRMGFLVDPLSIVMLLVVTGVGSLIHIYSIGYMHDDPGFSRYFASLSLFTFSMLGIVVSNNYVQTYIFWELVGLSSYLLIGFWFDKPSAAEASKKAFLTTRVGDFGFMIGIVLLYFNAGGSFNFADIDKTISSGQVAPWVLTASALLIFSGAVGKSAQFPLHVWLPDAMEGPTPVSALIHAATMVAAGVYLVARSYFLFAASPVAMEVVGMIGGFTALMAATIAIAQSDIKRIIAYSTLSQLGLMMLAMGVGSMTAGMFHLTTHAFFKALLFLGAGSVIHALHTQEIWQMGGVRKLMRITAPTFLVGALANAGVFPFSGFWSKDDIIASAFESGHYGLFLIGLITTFFTGLYMFRLYFVVFHGEPSKKGHGAAHGAHAEEAHPHEEPHESPRVMTVPLIILAVFATVAGFVNVPGLTSGFSSYIYFRHPHPLEFRPELAFLSLSAALAGILVAWLYYGKRQYSADELVAKYPAIYHVLLNKYYFDELYFWVIRNVQDVAAIVCNWFEEWIIITTFVNGTSRMTRWAGGVLRLTQTGQLATYLLIFVAGVIVLVFLAFGGFVPYQMVAFR